MNFLLHLFSYWDSVLAVVLVLGGLIFVHELGHFLANRAMGIGVVTFSIGMGPKLWGFKRGKTEYRISWLPFGGFVAAAGEYSDEVEQLGFTKEEVAANRPPWQRMIMAFAGPFANLLTAWIIYWGLTFASGLSIPLPVVGDLTPNGPALTAGMQPGDAILSIDGKPVNTWNQVPLYVGASDGKELTVVARRGSEELTLHMTPSRMTRTNIFGEQENAWLIGVQASGATRHEPRTFFQAAGDGLRQTGNIIDLTLTGLKKLVTGSVPADSVGGPILIAQMLGAQAKMGMEPLLLLAALISVNLGLLNLLPIPVLDGGLILLSLIETVIRRPVPEKVQEYAMRLGVVLLLALMLFATFNDLRRWFQ